MNVVRCKRALIHENLIFVSKVLDKEKLSYFCFKTQVVL